ncbi:hypothetical protein [Oceanobacillus jeddahense]|uniref:Uncharacterized protein n=1 Tax=Oceanobacillus jeddahense TaxID=1462527 RepID=A0ABY5JU20_9BACI|nr:hypothetical protein [Oceanobacillus jeddahense]UUI03304.1 hypothetical protein NP439_00865 [Oceanobacillus jeddahense]
MKKIRNFVMVGAFVVAFSSVGALTGSNDVQAQHLPNDTPASWSGMMVDKLGLFDNYTGPL